MYATDKFVYIHEPKTGGTFVTSVLFELQELLGTRQLRVRSPRTAFIKAKLKHGGCLDIPRAQRHKQVLSTIRNPYDVYVSEYEFGWWRRPEYDSYFRHRVWRFRSRFPRFPELDFEQFVRLLNEAFCTWRNWNYDDARRIGFLSERFLKLYFRKPRRIIWMMDERYIESGGPQRDICDVHFLRTERLNQDLYDYLASLEYPAGKLAFILDLGRVRPEGSTGDDRRDWRDYYTPDFKQKVRHRERLLFNMFPEFDV